MKIFLVLLLAFVALVAGESVNVVENPEDAANGNNDNGDVVISDPDPNYYIPTVSTPSPNCVPYPPKQHKDPFARGK